MCGRNCCLTHLDKLSHTPILEKLRDMTVPLTVKLVPRYPEHVMGFYKLDDKLAALVGLPYLAHPKASMNKIYMYVDAHGLIKEKYIVCDKFLKDLFGESSVRLRTLWESISSKLISRVQTQPLVNTISLLDLSQSQLCSQTLNVDAELNLYPKDWHLREAEERVITKTKSTPSPPLTQPSARSSRTLKKHRSI